VLGELEDLAEAFGALPVGSGSALPEDDVAAVTGGGEDPLERVDRRVALAGLVGDDRRR
jgi:hypothetical protein